MLKANKRFYQNLSFAHCCMEQPISLCALELGDPGTFPSTKDSGLLSSAIDSPLVRQSQQVHNTFLSIRTMRVRCGKAKFDSGGL